MSSAPAYGPLGLIKSVLKCDSETAELVMKNLGNVLAHEPTRAFLAMAWHLSTTTRTVQGTRDDVLINEGKRQAGLFLVSCARAGMNLDLYHDKSEGPNA